MVEGFTTGFDIPFEGPKPNNEPPNLNSVKQHPEIVDNKIKKELSLNRISGPYHNPPFPDMVISPIGVIPKKQPGTFRMIHHLSYPKGLSINHGISRQYTSVHYHTVDDAIDILSKLGPLTFMAKTDIEAAFRIVPIARQYHHLLGFKWRDQYYYDKMLPMGLSISCKIFECFSTSIQWIAQNHLSISHMLHILDDFFIAEKTEQECSRHLNNFTNLCSTIEIPLAPEKTEGPLQILSFAGIELDTKLMEARLPLEKINKYLCRVQEIKNKKKVTLRELQSIIGSLNHCCYIIPAGRAFLRRLIDLTIGITDPHHHVRLNNGTRADLRMWEEFLTQFNGSAFFQHRTWINNETLHLYTDAAQSIGYGAICGIEWFCGVWPEEWKKYNITFLEFYPIVASVDSWGYKISNKRITIFTDNQALTFILNKLTSPDKKIMILIRLFVKLCMQYNILFHAEHVPGADNGVADALSRLQFQEFRQLAPLAEQSPITIAPYIQPANLMIN